MARPQPATSIPEIPNGLKELARIFNLLSSEEEDALLARIDALLEQQADKEAAFSQATQSAPYRYPLDMVFHCPN